MKPRKLGRLLQGVALGVCIFPWTATFAAQQEMLWGKADAYAPVLKNFSLIQSSSVPKALRLPKHVNPAKNSLDTFQFQSGLIDYANRSHVRYDQYYQGIPVWQSQIIYHVASDTQVTGSLISGIEKDVPTINGKLAVGQIKKIALGRNVIKTPVVAQKIIFLDSVNNAKTAILAWHVSYLNDTDRGPSMPNYIIDANSGKVLKEWEGLTTASSEDGTGLGGTTTLNAKPYQYGQFQAPTPQLGVLSNLYVTHATSSICTLNTDQFIVYNLKNQTEKQFFVPVSSSVERTLSPFAYYCSGPNLNDNGYAPVNGGISPVNDATYFIKRTIDMLKKYGVASPVGSQLPRVYTHVAEFDNAFACDSACMTNMGLVGPQQVVFGNGQTVAQGPYPAMFAPLTEGDVVAHEFGHLVTGHFSKLDYSDQTGGINEGFSDMTGMAMNNYMRNTMGATWYWDGTDWTTGKSITKSGKPLRYFYEPTLDGMSISSATKFKPGMNPHLSSGGEFKCQAQHDDELVAK